MKSKITFKVRSTGPGLVFTVRFDDREIIRHDDLGSDFREVSFDFDDFEETTHALDLVMSGKSQDHTKINDHGEILQDTVLEICDMALGDIPLGHLFYEISRYRHDFNGTKEPIVDEFFGIMGCNGTVEFKFNSPVYLWFLENM